LTPNTVRVTRQLPEVRGRGLAFGPAKSRASTRVVAIPELIIPVIRWHLSCFAQKEAEGLVFTSSRGQPMWNSQFRGRVWLPALREVGLTGTHFHDLRHSGNTLAASAGASVRELMDRMGHDSERAAMIYLHGSDERQHVIAGTLSKLVRGELKLSATGKEAASRKRSGTQRVRRPRRTS
jgi:integrase